MKLKHLIGMILCLAALASVTICMFTDWNDGLFLPLALGLSVAGNLCNVLPIKWGKNGKEQGR
ncbi:MAG: hypothetical protein PUK18_03655 [Firmicutes bacterium]|nr:hypothetical protein [Bacillota bacterium]MDY6159944.1 hypothetical protein [Candidatus Faecousia sp.]